MWVFTEHEKRRYKDYIIILVAGIGLHYVRSMNLFTAFGCMFGIIMIAELGAMVLGRIVARIIYERVYPKSIKELKHTNKQYQYILDVGHKQIYSYVYTVPLDTVDVKCWKFHGQYLVEVCRKHRARSG